jgi:hypothetical protein
MQNKYEGICSNCYKRVEPRAGLFERKDGRYRLVHAVCVKDDKPVSSFQAKIQAWRKETKR